MFASNRNGRTAIAPGDAAGCTYIAPGVSISGEVDTDDALQIDGHILGNVRAGSVITGKDSTIQGDIFASRVEIGGSVNGLIRADTITLEASSRISGRLESNELTVKLGAVVNGACSSAKKSGAGTSAPVLREMAALRLTPAAPAPVAQAARS